jgi:hypothetical protein
VLAERLSYLNVSSFAKWILAHAEHGDGLTVEDDMLVCDCGTSRMRL